MLDAIQIKLLLRIFGFVSLLFTIPWAVGAGLEIGSFVSMMARSLGPTGFFLPDLMPESTFHWMVQDSDSIIVLGVYSILLASLPMVGSICLIRAASWLVRLLVGNGAEHAT